MQGSCSSHQGHTDIELFALYIIDSLALKSLIKKAVLLQERTCKEWDIMFQRPETTKLRASHYTLGHERIILGFYLFDYSVLHLGPSLFSHPKPR